MSMDDARSIRPPAVAGLFYPDDPDALARKVDEFLARAMVENARVPTDRARMLVAPHAGYAYSGAVAARGFALLARDAYDTVVLVGPSHVDAFDFTSVFEGDAYRTPLGVLDVDRPAARLCARAHPSIRLSDRGHASPRHARGEHGLEVLLPFLQRACGRLQIVPIVMGDQGWDACLALGRAVAAAMDPERTLVVASSDLSHFHSYDEAVRRDAAFCEVLTTLDAARLYDALRMGRCEACGAGPVMAGLVASATWKERRCRVLACINSGDVTGEHDSVVGYASAVVATP
jgi:AmmeMemoRadiSam system protein B